MYHTHHRAFVQPLVMVRLIVCDLLEPLLRKNAVPWCLHVAPRWSAGVPDSQRLNGRLACYNINHAIPLEKQSSDVSVNLFT
ncbi:hypothetical protein PHET_01607 [Paragonimus heterotremus]|uniref:Secreted protein n=1 Tax=Paragonimus heterotremus TaxID=100268 RepID=A0A8J4T5H6_9TREM|nr:hypothetical protein PHET_01607 [Paragonimus heterotremus]